MEPQNFSRENKKIIGISICIILILIPCVLGETYDTVNSTFYNFTWQGSNLNNNLAISAWVNGPFSVFSPIIRSSTGYTLFINNNKLNITFRNDSGQSTFTSTTSISTNSWNHVAAIYNGTSVILYVNGVGTASSYSGGYLNGSSWILGLDANYFNGTIDDVMIFNRSLSADEILSIYNATKYQHTQTNLTDGAHTFKAYTQDLAGNMNNSGVISFTTDTSFPRINITYPINGTTYSNYVTDLNYTIDSGSYCWYSNNSGTTNSSSVSAGTNWTNINISAKGSNTWTLWCNDSANNINSTSVIFTVDNTDPTLNVTSPVNSSTYNSSSVLFNVSSSEEGTGSIIPDIDNSLVSWWRMDDVNATTGVIDYMGRNNGTRVNAVQTSAGKLGKGMSFDGSTSYVNMTNTFNFGNGDNFTISLWFNSVQGTTTVQEIIGKRRAVANSWALWYRGSDGLLNFEINGNNALRDQSSTTSITINGWHYATAKYENNRILLYVDAILKSNISYTDVGNFNNSNFVQIGKQSGTSASYFNGTIDDVMIFNRSLSSDEILSIYNATKYQHTQSGLNDGSHTFKAYTQDLAGNMNNSGVISFTTDTTYPIINITYPINGTTYSNYVTNLNYTIDSGSYCWYSNNSGTSNSTSVNAGTNWTNINISIKGSNTWTLYCNDTANNINSSSVIFSVDNTDPTLNVTSPVNSSTYNSSSVLFNVSSSELGTGSIIPDIDNSLVSWWRMDDVNATTGVIDYMGRNNGTRVNATQTDAGKLGKGMSFDGNGDYINVSNTASLNITGNLTYLAWVKRSKTGDYHYVFDKRISAGETDGFYLVVWNTDVIRCGISGLSDTNIISTQTIDINWHLVGCKYNGTAISTIYDGTIEKSEASTGSLNTTTINLKIGEARTNNFWFNGTIDDVMIFNRSLSSDEIASLYNATKYQHTQNSLTEGAHTFKAYTQDLAGNMGTSSLIGFNTDTIIPTLNVTSPINSSNYNSSSVLFNVSSSEEGTGSIIPDIDNSLVSWWRMDDTNQSVGSYGAKVIDYMNRNNGTSYGNASQTDAGKLGKGMSFDGDGDYVDAGNSASLNITGEITISVFIKTVNPGTAARIISKGENGNYNHGYFLGVESTASGRIVFGDNGGWWKMGSGNISDGLWHHIVGTYNNSGDETGYRIYVDGILKDGYEQGTANGFNWTTQILSIGGQFDDGVFENSFNGTIDDVMIFNRSLSSDEILSLYNATKYQHTQSNLSEGAHTFKAYTQDLAGNMNASSLISFGVDTIYPSVALLSPANNSGDNDGNVSFIFNVTDANAPSGNIINCSLIINDAVNLSNSSVVNGINTSFIVNELSAGNYNWSVNCSDSAGNINNSAVWKLAVVETSSEFSGGTTDFSNVNISNITNLVLDSPNYGKINFSESVDLSAGGDINSFVNISFNRIEVNITGISALDKSARLTLYNLTYSDPRVLKDGSVCSDCSEVGYTSSTGTFVFDVTGFSVYSAGETPATATPAADTGSSGGGGGSALTKIIEDFSVDTTELKVRIVLNDVREREIKIKNTGENNITIKARLEGEGMEEIINFENDELSLGVGEEEVLKLNITAKELEIYTGKIILSSMRKTKEVLVTINTQSKETLFDISLAIPENTINKDEALKAQINLIPIGEKGVDVTLKYLIKDFKGKVYYEESETFYVDEQKSFAKEFKTDMLEYESYVLGIEMTYAGGFASTSAHFEIKEEEKPITFIKAYYIYFIILIILIIAVLFVIFELRKMQKYKRYKR